MQYDHFRVCANVLCMYEGVLWFDVCTHESISVHVCVYIVISHI